MVYARIIGIRFFEQTVQYHNVLSTCKNVLIGVTSYVRTILKFTAKLEHAYTHTFNSPFSGTTHVSRCQKGKANLDFTEARDSEWQWHQLDHMQVCT